MRVAIVGAGIAGLAAARSLRQGGIESVVFEALDEVGGRVQTRRIGSFVFDTGATSIAPRGRSLEPVMLKELDQKGLAPVGAPIYTHVSLRVEPGDIAKQSIPRFAYHQGNDRLPNLLAEGLDIRFSSPIEKFETLEDGRYGVQGSVYDALILTAPAPESHRLLKASSESRPLAHCTYRFCLCVLLGYELPNPTSAYHAIIDPEQRHPLTWLSLESVKCTGRAAEGHTALVAQLGPQYSIEHFDLPDEEIISTTAHYVGRLYGEEWERPGVAEVVRWRYSLPEMTAIYDSVNLVGSTLIVAGDGVLGGRVEYAFETGMRAARSLLRRT